MRHIANEAGWRIDATPDDLLEAAQRYAAYHSGGRYLSGKIIRYPGVDLWTEGEIAAIFWKKAGLRPAQSVPAHILPAVEGGAGPILLGGDIQFSQGHRPIEHPSNGKTVRFYSLKSVPVKSGFYTLTFNPHTENHRIVVYAHHKLNEWRTKAKHNLQGDWQPVR